jgi:hypothetical protein
VGLYDDIQTAAGDALGEFGQAVTLTSPGVKTRSTATGAVTTGTPATQTASGVVDNYSLREIDGSNVQRGDQKLYLSALNSDGDAITAPVLGSTATVNGAVWRVMEVETVSPAGTPVLYVLQLRK